MSLRKVLYTLVTITLLSLNALSYEDKTHKALTDKAVKYVLSEIGELASYKDQIIAGSGAGPEGTDRKPIDSDGEDYTRYKPEKQNKCLVSKKAHPYVDKKEPLRHFNGKMGPFGPASARFVEMWEDAVDYWKNGDKVGAAFILGRLCHLVEDLAQPQHAVDESHSDKNYYGLPIQDLSFLEEFTEANIVNDKPDNDYCANSRFDYSGQIAICKPVIVLPPVGQSPVDNLNYMQKNSAEMGQAYLNGGTFDTELLNNLFGPPDLINGNLCRKQAILKCTCDDFAVHFQFSSPHTSNTDPYCGYKGYYYTRSGGGIGPSSGITGDYTTDLEQCSQNGESNDGKAVRVDFAIKLHQTKGDKARPQSFGQEHFDNLLKPAIGYSAGVIIAFWNKVKDPEPCDSNGGKYTEAGVTCPTCDPPPGHPAGDGPDDSVFVKSSRSENSSDAESESWRNICRVGIGKGLATMADYGVSSSLMDQISALDENSDPATAQILYDRLDGFMTKYSGPQNVMPEEVEAAPFIAVAERGFYDSTKSLIESLGEPVKLLEEPRERVLDDEESLSILPPKRGLLDADPAKQKILVLPTGSLFGLRKNSIEHAVLQSFAEQGGVVICFTQAFGDDFTALPVPEGEELLAAGFKQDVSCFGNSAYPVLDHPILSGITSSNVTAGFDGFFRKVPSNATILLRRSATGEPCFIVYPVGTGWVVATTMFEDWARINGQSSRDGESMVANVISWAKDTGNDIPETDISTGGNVSSIALNMNVRNLSDNASDRIEIVVMSPERRDVVLRQTVPFIVEGHSNAVFSVDLDMSGYFGELSPRHGIFHTDYRLLAFNETTGLEEEIQPQGETVTGQFIVTDPDEERRTISETVFSVWTDSDLMGDEDNHVHVHIGNNSGSDMVYHLYEGHFHETPAMIQVVEVTSGQEVNIDLPRNFLLGGRYGYYLKDPSGKTIASASISIMSNLTDPLAITGGITGLKTKYLPGETLSGETRVINKSGRTLNLTLVASVETPYGTSSENHELQLGPYESKVVDLSLSIPDSSRYFNRAVVFTKLYIGSMVADIRSRPVAVESKVPVVTMTPHWPDPPTLDSLGTITVSVANGAGDSVRTADCILLGMVEDITDPGSPVIIESITYEVPSLGPGSGYDVTLNWEQWHPAAGSRYRMEFRLRERNSEIPFNQAVQSRIYDTSVPKSSWVNGSAVPGSSSVIITGGLMNAAGIAWTGEISMICPALGEVAPRQVAVAPNSMTPVNIVLPRPDSLVPGEYPITMIFSGEGIENPTSVQGIVQVSTPYAFLTFPDDPSSFRHDQDASFPVKVSLANAEGPVGAIMNATMTWNGGSASIADGMPLTLDPASPLDVLLELPITRMPAPGAFSIDITVQIPQGNVSYNFNGGYALKGAEYAVNMSTLSIEPPETVQCQLSNSGAFEGICNIEWILTDPVGNIVVWDARNAVVPIGSSISFEESVPALLPGNYEAAIWIHDIASGGTRTITNQIEVRGTTPSLSLDLDKELYGTMDPVNISLRLEDPGHLCGDFEIYTVIERYLGKGGGVIHSDTPGANWGTFGGDGSGTLSVGPSDWFYDPDSGNAAFVEEMDYNSLNSDVLPVSADINDDEKTDMLTINGGILLISSEGDLTNFQAARATNSGGIADGSGSNRSAGLEGHVKARWPGQRGKRTEDHPYVQLAISVKDEWGIDADNWTRCFMMGFRDDHGPGVSPLLIGMYDPAAQKASILLVRIGGPLVWRRDYEQVGAFYNSFLRLADFNADGIMDPLISAGSVFQALDGTTGNTLWQNDQLQGYFYNVLVGYSGTVPGVWTYFWNEEAGNKLAYIGASGNIELLLDPPSDYFFMALSDVDGDGTDEAVLGGTDQVVYVFEADGSNTLAPLSLSNCGAFGLFDLNSDGRDDIVYARCTCDPDGYYYPESLSAVDLMTGQTIWTQNEAAGETPVFYECGTEGKKILSYPNRGEDNHGRAHLLDGATGAIEQSLNDIHFASDICTAGDYNGDGVTEFLLYGSIIQRGCSYPDGSVGICSDWETIWEKDELLSQNGADVMDINYNAGAMDLPGSYRASSYIYTSNDQWIESGPVGFTVVETALGASMSPAAGVSVKTRESYSGSIKVVNKGESEETGIDVFLFKDGEQYASWTISSVAPGVEEVLPFTIPPSVEGRHAIEVSLEKSGIAISNLKSFYMSVSPVLEIDVQAPAFHLGDTFEIPVVLRNYGEVDATVEVALSDDPLDAVELSIAPYGKTAHTFHRRSAASFSAELLISGEYEKSVPISVPHGYQIELAIPEMQAWPRGIIRVPVQVAQAGLASYSGSLIATLTPPAGDPLKVELPINLGPGETKEVTIPIPTFEAGRAGLKIEASAASASVSRDVVIYEGGIGTVNVELPSLIGEGTTMIPFVLHNSLDSAGEFDLSLLSGIHGPNPVARQSMVVPPGGSVEGTLSPSLEAGTDTLTLVLNGVEAASGNVVILKNVDAGFSLELKERPDASRPVITALVENTGFMPLDACLTVYADEVRPHEIHLERGSHSAIDMEIDPDKFGGESGEAKAILLLPDGTSIERNLALAFSPAQVTVAPPPASPVIIPGQPQQITFTCSNAGDLSSEIAIGMDFADGETSRYETTALVQGHSTAEVNMDISLAGDIPNSVSNAHYIAWSKETDATIAEGDFPVTVEGPTVEVTSSLDGVAFAVGSTMTLSVGYSLIPSGSSPMAVTTIVMSGESEFTESISVSGDMSRTYSFPVDDTTKDVSVNVLLPTGRSIYINKFRVYPYSSGFSIHPDKCVYEAGENIAISASLPSPGALKLEFRDQETVVSGSGNVSHSFQTPGDAREDSYILYYEYTPEDTSISPSNGSIPIDVRGVVATSGESELDRSVYYSGEEISGRVVIQSNRQLSGSLEYFITYPDGSWTFLGKENVTVPGDIPLRRAFAFPFTSVKAGSHSLGFMLVGSSREIYVEGALPFTSCQAALLSLSTERTDYPEGSAPVEAVVKAAGFGSAELSIFMDGTLVNQQALNLNGVSNAAYSLGAVSPKEHSVKAVIVDGNGQESSAYCRFIYGSALPDLSGYVSGGGQENNVIKLACIVQNKGRSAAQSFKVALYEGDPAQGGTFLGNILVSSVEAGGNNVATYDWDVSGRSGQITIHAVIDSDEQVREWDETNNMSATKIVLTDPPVITVTPEEGSCSNVEVVPSANVTPEGFAVSMTLDDEPYESGTPVAGEGEHVLVVNAANLEGASFSVTRNFSIDMTAPSVEIVSPAEGETVEPGFIPVITTSDPGIDDLVVVLDGQPYVTGTPVSDPGLHELTAHSSDDCGNESGMLTRGFTVSGGSAAPALPSVVGDFSFFGCDLLTVNGSVRTCGVPSAGGEQGFGGHVGSNGGIKVSGSNIINGNATPGPGYTVKITGRPNQVAGVTDPAGSILPCEAQSVSEWASYALANNNNSMIPASFIDKQGNLVVNGSKTCALPSGTYIVSSLTVNGSAKLIAGGKVVIVSTGAVTINGNCSVNQYGNPGDLVIVCASGSAATINGGSKASMQIYAPLSNVIVNGSVAGYGDIWGKTMTVNGSVVWSRINGD